MYKYNKLLILSLLAGLAAPQISAIAQSEGEGEPGGTPGVSACSPGSEGMPDTDAQYQAELKRLSKKGPRSIEYIGGLIGLGMHYNRAGKHAQAQKVLSQALAIIDSGALKPAKGSVAERPPTVVDHGDGTVSATVNKPPAPYEETLEQLLPPLIEAETMSNNFVAAETHIKRWISMAQKDRINKVPNLMFAYSQYANLMTRMGRKADAARYQKEADRINSTIRGL